MGLLISLLCLFGTAQANAAGGANEFVQMFRNGEFDRKILRLTGRDAEQYIRLEPCGLRVAMPPRRGDQAVLGVTPGLRICGDFEVTASFRILALRPPAAGSGLGVSLYLLLDTPGRDAVSLRRFVTPEDGDVFLANRTRSAADGKRRGNGTKTATRLTSGRLRLTRTGETVHYLVAEGTDGPFRQIDQVAVGNADVVLVRLAAESTRPSGRLEACFPDLRIRAEHLLVQPPGGLGGMGRSPWPIYAVLGLAAALLALWYAWIRVRRSRTSG